MTSFLVQAVCETLWPTRCVLCDAHGTLLCDACASRLRYIDFYQACPSCGSPWGRIQCDACNDVAREHKPLAKPCISCLEYDGAAATIVKSYKDKGEQRLAAVMARMMAKTIPPTAMRLAARHLRARLNLRKSDMNGNESSTKRAAVGRFQLQSTHRRRYRIVPKFGVDAFYVCLPQAGGACRIVDSIILKVLFKVGRKAATSC